MIQISDFCRAAASFNKPFKAEDQFIPTDPYGLSKYEAEQGLLALAKATGMDVVIILRRIYSKGSL
ncbi:MAG: nucleoside-diphosphate-sugar epimerase [Neolewinella sp.]|jgi:nucleoside-diphosphate-sugar epimerase